MNYQERKALYENVMRDIAKMVKQKIKDFAGSTENQFRAIDNFVMTLVHKWNNQVKNEVSPDDVEHLFDVDFSERAASVSRMTHHPSLKEDFSVESFNTKFADVQKHLKILYDISDWQISVVDNFDTGQNDVNIVTVYDSAVTVDIVIANIEHNVNVLNDFMQRNGYFLIRKIEASVPFREVKKGNLVHLVYTPIVRKDVSSDVRHENSLLLHMTSEENLESIKRNGLTPRERTGLKGITYPARIYLFTERAEQEEWFSMYQYQLSEEKEDSGRYVVIEVDLNKLPDSIKMFYDPLIGRDAVYVEDTIRPEGFGDIYELKK